jgi:hypothetical protein
MREGYQPITSAVTNAINAESDPRARRAHPAAARIWAAITSWHLERFLIPLAVLLLVVISMRGLDPLDMNDYGLISILPWQVFLGLAVLSVSYALALRRRPINPWLLAAHLVVLIVILHGATAMIEDLPRFQTTWKHIGITDYVIRTGNVDPLIDAYFNWPGFFILNAFITRVMGMDSLLMLTPWASVFFNLMAIGPLLMIFRPLFRDERPLWLGLWWFFLANWIGQDYFAPQAFGFLMHLVILGILLTYFADARPRLTRAGWWPRALIGHLRNTPQEWRAEDDDVSHASMVPPAQRMLLVGAIALIRLALVPSHQLSPFATLLTVTALVLLNRCSLRTLPIYMGVIAAAWIIFQTVPFLEGHVQGMLTEFGSVGESVNANVSSRIGGSPEHNLVLRSRMLMTVLIWGLAALGGLRRLYVGRLDLTYAVIALAPFPLLALQNYGGEALLRIYLFALPGMALFLAALFFPRVQSGRSWITTGAIILLSFVMVGGFFITRYGNERMDFYTQDERDAVAYLYRTAPQGSLLFSGSPNLPWRDRDYETYGYYSFSEGWPIKPQLVGSDVDLVLRQVIDQMRESNRPGTYIIFSRSEEARTDLLGELPRGALTLLEEHVVASGEFRLVYGNKDARIYTLLDDPSTSERSP